MPYTPTVWKDGDLVTSEKLNKIEEGVWSNNNKMLHIVEFPGALMIPDATWQEIYENNFTTFILTNFQGKAFHRLKEICTDKISNQNYVTLTINNSQFDFVARDINDNPVYSYIPPFISIPFERRVTNLVDNNDSTYTVEDIQSSIEFFQDPHQQFDGGVVFNVYGTLNIIEDSDTGGFQNVLVIQKNSEINREGLQLDVLYQDRQTEAIESENVGLLQDINYIKVFNNTMGKTIGFKIYNPNDNNLISQTYFIKCNLQKPINNYMDLVIPGPEQSVTINNATVLVEGSQTDIEIIDEPLFIDLSSLPLVEYIQLRGTLHKLPNDDLCYLVLKINSTYPDIELNYQTMLFNRAGSTISQPISILPNVNIAIPLLASEITASEGVEININATENNGRTILWTYEINLDNISIIETSK